MNSPIATAPAQQRSRNRLQPCYVPCRLQEPKPQPASLREPGAVPGVPTRLSARLARRVKTPQSQAGLAVAAGTPALAPAPAWRIGAAAGRPALPLLLPRHPSAHTGVKETSSAPSLKQRKEGEQKPQTPQICSSRAEGKWTGGSEGEGRGRAGLGASSAGLCCRIRCSCNYTLISVVFLKLDHFTDLL